MICDVVQKVRTVLDCVSGREHTVRTIILMEEKDSELTERAEKEGIQIINLRELEVNTHTHTHTHIHTATLRCFTP